MPFKHFSIVEETSKVSRNQRIERLSAMFGQLGTLEAKGEAKKRYDRIADALAQLDPNSKEAKRQTGQDVTVLKECDGPTFDMIDSLIDDAWTSLQPEMGWEVSECCGHNGEAGSVGDVSR